MFSNKCERTTLNQNRNWRWINHLMGARITSAPNTLTRLFLKLFLHGRYILVRTKKRSFFFFFFEMCPIGFLYFLLRGLFWFLFSQFNKRSTKPFIQENSFKLFVWMKQREIYMREQRYKKYIMNDMSILKLSFSI